AITAKDGAVSIHSGAGNIDLTKGNITAKNDISLISDSGYISIVGSNVDARANITSAAGNVTIKAGGGGTAVTLTSANITAAQGNISINGTTTGSYSGVRFDTVNMTVNSDFGLINVYASSRGYWDDYQEFGSLYFGRVNIFTASKMNFTGDNTGGYLGAGVAFKHSNVTFNGDAVISGSGGKGVGFRTSTLNFNNGDSEIYGLSNKNTDSPDNYYGTGAIFFDGWSSYESTRLNVVLNNANLTMSADSSNVKSNNPKYGVGAFSMSGIQTKTLVPGMIFSGVGNVSIIGKANDGSGVEARYFDNQNLQGGVSICGSSNTGVGVELSDRLAVSLKNANITGSSISGAGVDITTGTSGNPVVELGETKIKGTSDTGNGLNINGDNVTIIGGALTGVVTSGNGSGVVLTGGNNYNLDGTLVTGTATDGSGISVNGTLAVNNGTQVVGRATGDGDGVVVSGNLTTDAGNGVILDGTASSGDGIKVTGNTALTGAILKGQTDSGSGVNIAGNLTTDRATTVTGQSTNGTGVNLGASLSGGTVTGISDTHTGLQLSDKANVAGSMLSGSSTSGNGVVMKG
ncbi:TPA: hypothetical protein MND73_004796, partial [Salmonella enterica subsp. houtenae]|nr:hypothetical protein [Salmonella enterica subsp. houtenae]